MRSTFLVDFLANKDQAFNASNQPKVFSNTNGMLPLCYNVLHTHMPSLELFKSEIFLSISIFSF